MFARLPRFPGSITLRQDELTQRLESALFGLFLAILVWAPLPFASNRVWGGALLTALLGMVLCGWLLLFVAGRTSIDRGVWQQAKWPLAVLLMVQVWVGLQLLAIPPPWVEILSPKAYEWHIREGWITLSLDPQHGQYYLLRGLGFTAGFFLTVVFLNSQRRVKLFLQVLVFSGTFQALYGAFMVLSGLELGFLVEKYIGRGVATGTFVNRNHFAGYLVICLSAGIGLLLSQLDSGSPSSWRESARRWLRLLLSPKIRLRIYLAIMVIALVLSRSRMGNVAFFVALSVAGGVSLYAGRRFSPRLIAFLASLFFVDMVILGRWFGFDRLVQRLEHSNPLQEGRAWSNDYAMEYLADFSLTGSGGGSFYGIFPNYQGLEFPAFHQHAHNDYLELSLELGVPATLLLVSLGLWAMFSAYAVQRDRHSRIYRGAGFAVMMTVVWAAVHSAADFNLQIPANAVTFTCMLALAFVVRGLPSRRGVIGSGSIPPDMVNFPPKL